MSIDTKFIDTTKILYRKLQRGIEPVLTGAKQHKHQLYAYYSVAVATVLFRLWLYVSFVQDRLLFFLSDIMLLLVIGYTLHVFRMFSDTGTVINEAKEARIAAEQANEAKGRFLANMSHEIRTPINAILGMNEMILRESNDENIKGYAYDIESAGSNLLSLVNDILDFSKIEAGEMDIVETEYEVGPLINDLKAMFAVRAEEKQLKLRFDIDGRIPKKLYGDPLRVKQICMNLLSNAVKYTDNGQITFRLTWNREKTGDAYITIKVTDTGRGIRKEDLGQLFDKFQRADLKNNNNIEGTGLGLSITKTLVERMSGHMEVESEYHFGSTFTAIILQGVRDPEPLGDYRAYKSEKHDEKRGEKRQWKIWLQS